MDKIPHFQEMLQRLNFPPSLWAIMTGAVFLRERSADSIADSINENSGIEKKGVDDEEERYRIF
jgi:hypothetical protein